MYKPFNLDLIKSELNIKSYIYEGDNNVSILKTDKNMYSLKKDDLNSLKLLFEIAGLKYDIIPFKYNKYKKILDKYAKNNEVWLFQSWIEGPNWTYSPFDFKTNKINWKNYDPELLEAANKFNYTVHLNEKPSSWAHYSNNL